MSQMLRAIVGASALLWIVRAWADPTASYAVQLAATVNADPARIELTWTPDPQPTLSYSVQRKNPGETIWGNAAVLGADATSFIDENVEVGHVYEYQVTRLGVPATAYGYIAVGINAPLIDSPGKVILVVEQTVADPLAGKLDRLQDDLGGDGWVVVRKNFPRDGNAADLRAAIKADYDADREHVKAVFLFGHLPIAFSGHTNVDGHQARPLPADVYYGEMDGPWTDEDGDGVFDQNTIPSDVDLQVGRVDFANFTGKFAGTEHAFPSEVELLARYLDKDHAFRHAEIRATPRALMGNVAGDGGGQAYAASGYRNFAALVGAAKIEQAGVEPTTPENERWISRLGATDYLWVYGCGGGDYFSVGGLGLHGEYRDLWSSDFVEQKTKGTFYLMFGSWFVDWSRPDNLLRAALAAPDYGLAAAWSGRPHLFFHTMGVGETIGQGIRLSQNNDGLVYRNQVQRQPRGIHIALLGDPTLRMQQLGPVRDLDAVVDGNTAALAWKAPADPVLGYRVYRGPTPSGPFVRISDELVSDTRFVDTQRSADTPVYLVRAVTLEVGPSGSFYLASQGVAISTGATRVATTVQLDSSDATRPADRVWSDDALPDGGVGYASENDRWNWVAANPAPVSGSFAHQSELAGGLHHHFAVWSTPKPVAGGDTLFAYIYLDPENPPRTVMLTWCAQNWEHRAYWGENLTSEGIDGTASRRALGPLPPAGRWVRLEVPASLVDLENRGVIGIGFTLVGGRATWDRAGQSHP